MIMFYYQCWSQLVIDLYIAFTTEGYVFQELIEARSFHPDAVDDGRVHWSR